MKKCILDALVQVDIYGYPVTLNFQNNTKYRSPLGGILSLLTISFVIFLTFNGIISLFNRSNDYLSVQTSVEFSPPLQRISVHDFTFFIKAEYDGFAKLNTTKQLLNMSLTQVRSSKVNSDRLSKVVEMKLEPCKKSHFTNINNLNFEEQFELVGLESYLCPSPNQFFNLSGMPSSDIFDYLEIRINKCENFDVCYNPGDLGSFVDMFDTPHFKIIFGFTNTFLDTQANVLRPFIYQSSVYTTLQGEYTKTDVLIRKTTYFEDHSIFPLMNEQIEQMYYNVPDTNIKSQTITIFQNGTLADIDISLAQEFTLITKKYYRVDEFLAYLGGILQTCFFVLTFFIGNYNRFGFYVSLANRLYTFDLKPSKDDSYSRQTLTDDHKMLTLDQISKRIKERVEKIRKTMAKFTRGAHLLIDHNRLASLMSKDLHRKESSNALSPDMHPDSNNPFMFQSDHILMDVIPEINSNQNSGDPDTVNNEDQKHPAVAQPVRNIMTKPLMGKTNDRQTTSETPSVALALTSNIQTPQAVDAKDKIYHPMKPNLIPELDFKDRQDFLQTSFNDVMKYSRTIKMSSIYLVTRLMCRKFLLKQNEKLQLLDRAVHMLKKDTDIISILEKLQDIDKLKKLVLTRDQMMVFNYTPKPVVRAHKSRTLKMVTFQDEKPKRRHALNHHDALQHDLTFLNQLQSKKVGLLQSKKRFKSLKSFFKLYIAYDHLFHQKDKDLTKAEQRVNHKLMHLIGEELRDVFETSYYLEDSTDILNREGNHKHKQHSQRSPFLHGSKLAQQRLPITHEIDEEQEAEKRMKASNEAQH